MLLFLHHSICRNLLQQPQETNTMHYISGMLPGILILMHQFFIGKVAEIRLEINNHYEHIMGLQVRFPI